MTSGYRVKLIVVGSGRGAWDDLGKAGSGDVMCINDMIMHYPGDVHHICSCDGPMLSKWWAARRPPYKKMFPVNPRFHTVDNDQTGLDKNIELWPFSGGGTSGLFACFVGLGLGYDEIVLCGVPIDNSGHYWEDPNGKTNFQREIADKHGRIRGDGRRFWGNAAEKFDGRVKSMSGFTKELLGSPIVHDHKQRA